MDLLGGSLVALDALDRAASDPVAAATSPMVEVMYGRLVLINTSNEERAVRMVLGPTSA